MNTLLIMLNTSNYEEDDKRLLQTKKTLVSLKMGQVERLQQNFLRLEQKNMHKKS